VEEAVAAMVEAAGRLTGKQSKIKQIEPKWNGIIWFFTLSFQNSPTPPAHSSLI